MKDEVRDYYYYYYHHHYYHYYYYYYCYYYCCGHNHNNQIEERLPLHPAGQMTPSSSLLTPGSDGLDGGNTGEFGQLDDELLRVATTCYPMSLVSSIGRGGRR